MQEMKLYAEIKFWNYSKKNLQGKVDTKLPYIKQKVVDRQINLLKLNKRFIELCESHAQWEQKTRLTNGQKRKKNVQLHY